MSFKNPDNFVNKIPKENKLAQEILKHWQKDLSAFWNMIDFKRCQRCGAPTYSKWECSKCDDDS